MPRAVSSAASKAATTCRRWAAAWPRTSRRWPNYKRLEQRKTAARIGMPVCLETKCVAGHEAAPGLRIDGRRLLGVEAVQVQHVAVMLDFIDQMVVQRLQAVGIGALAFQGLFQRRDFLLQLAIVLLQPRQAVRRTLGRCWLTIARA